MTPGELATERVHEPLTGERILWTEMIYLDARPRRMIGTVGQVSGLPGCVVGRILVGAAPGPGEEAQWSDFEMDELLAGLVWVQTDQRRIWDVWVDPEHQMEGVARGLVDAYERSVSGVVIMKGPLNASGRLLAVAVGAEVTE